MRAGRGGLLVAELSSRSAALAVLIALGIWQLERKAWKEELIATLERRLRAAPVVVCRRRRNGRA